jgi:tetratricopeptide (TPR) repeat protein
VLLLWIVWAGGDRLLAQFPGRLAGTVTTKSGTPVQNAAILAEIRQGSPVRWNTTSDKEGRFAILGVRPGTWWLTVTAPGFDESRLAYQVRPNRPGEPIEVKLERRERPAVPLPLQDVDGSQLVREIDRAEGLLRAGRADDALDIYRTWLRKTPDLTSLHLAMARAHRAKRDFGSAKEACDVLLQREPANVQARLELASVHLDSGDENAARRELERVLQDASESSASRTARQALVKLTPSQPPR